MKIEARHINKSFGSFIALRDVNVSIPAGELVALLGPSGSGKTTLLRIIAGLESPDAGAILYGGEDQTRRSAKDRNVGFVFQHYALFNNMNVFENIAFGLRVRKTPNAKVERRVRELLHLIRLEGLESRSPSQLSGGQRQRVALARALAVEPKVLLLDEPFGALDGKVRQELRQWLRRLHDEIHVTSVFVTHDQEEAFEVADRVVVMNQGRVEQAGTPREVFEQPENAFVTDFLGNVNVLRGRVQGGRALLGGLEWPYPEYPHHDPSPATAYIRTHELEVARYKNNKASLEAEVRRVNAAGPAVKLSLRAPDVDGALHAEVDHGQWEQLNLSAGDRVYVTPRRIRIFVQGETKRVEGARLEGYRHAPRA
jgi:sulfate/thiosulfate transport system ATP-binding protein